MAPTTGNGAAPRGRDRRRLSFHLSAVRQGAIRLQAKSIQFNAAPQEIGASWGGAFAARPALPTRGKQPGSVSPRGAARGPPPSEHTDFLSSTPRIRSLPGVCLPQTPESRRKSPRYDSRPQNRRRWETPRRH